MRLKTPGAASAIPSTPGIRAYGACLLPPPASPMVGVSLLFNGLSTMTVLTAARSLTKRPS